jgi:hypothetical protein
MLHLEWRCPKITAMQYSLVTGIGSIAKRLFKKKQRAARTMICVEHGDFDSSRVRDLGCRLEVKINYPLGIDAELLADKVCGRSTAVNRSVAPILAESNVVITMEVAEKISITSFNGSVAKCIYAY